MTTATVVLIAVALSLAAITGLWLGYRASGLYAARQRAMRAVSAIRDDHASLRALPGRLWFDLLEVAGRWASGRFEARLRALPVEQLKQSGITNVRWSALRSAGFQSLADLRGVAAVRLQSLPGVGPATAERVASATSAVVNSLQAEPVPLPSGDLSEPDGAALILKAASWMKAQALDVDSVRQTLEATTPQLQQVQATTGFSAWIAGLLGDKGIQAVADADALAHRAEAFRSAPDFHAIVSAAVAIEKERGGVPAVADLVLRYRQGHPEFKAVLSRAFAERAPAGQPATVRPVPLAVPAVPSLPARLAATEPVRVRTPAPVARGFAIPAQPGGGAALTFTLTITGSHQEAMPPDDARWCGSGEEVRIAGHAIPGGLLYVGRHLAAISPYRGVDPALVNPHLPANVQDVDWSGERMGYWPSYSEIPPECRGAYLRWLANGRRHPTVGIGYVFLFFYGLERRLLHDGAQGAAESAERQIILGEVGALLSVYGAQPSFRRYASDLLAVCRLQGGSARSSDAPPPKVEPGTEIPLSVRAGLGEIVQEGRPIPTEWALAWVRSHPETRWRTPAQRCAVELESLFAARYRARFGEGLVVKPNRTRLTGTYRPASASFGGSIGVPVGDLPDVAVLDAPVQKLRELVYGCVDDLEPYSRVIGRDPNGRGSLAALALLPKELVSTSTSPEAERLLGFARRNLEQAPSAIVSARALLEEAQITAAWTRPLALSIAQWLQKAGYGIEPDVRFGARPPKAADKLVLFHLPADGSSTPTPAYAGAVALLDMAILVAQADGTVDADEEKRLTARLQDAMHLDDGERSRLSAHLKWQLATGASFTEIKKRTAQLDPSRRDAVAAYLLSVAAADGRLDRKEVEVLGRLYALLGLDDERLYADLHGFGLPDAKRKDADQPGAKRRPEAFTLDRARIEAKMAESAAVSALLQDIFSGDDVPPVAPPIVPEGVLLAGFDAAHSALLRELVERDSLTRSELEAWVQRIGLLPDGALDVLNERAYDVCGEPVLEGDDPLMVNRPVLKELMA